MDTSAQSVRWVSWALVVLAIATAITTLMFVFGILLPAPPGEIDDFLQRLEAFRNSDRQLFPFVVLSSLIAVGLFLVAAILGTVLRALARPSALRDAMTLMFVIGGALGIGANILNIGAAQAATWGYCDCGYKAEELIAQDYTVSLGFTAVNWLAIGAITLTGIGVALAGRLVELSPAWRTLSYVIAVVVVVAVSLRVITAFVFIEAFDAFQVSDLLVAAAAGVLVPIWAILLARGAERPALAVEPAAA